jgi:hypothetical protein
MAKEKLIGDIAHAQLHIFGQDASGAPVVGTLIGADLERRVTELPVVVRKSK